MHLSCYNHLRDQKWCCFTVMSKNDPFANLILDEEEKELEAALENGEFEESSDFQDTKKMLQDAAKQYRQLYTLKKSYA
jgi:hypothetical protein